MKSSGKSIDVKIEKKPAGNCIFSKYACTPLTDSAPVTFRRGGVSPPVESKRLWITGRASASAPFRFFTAARGYNLRSAIVTGRRFAKLCSNPLTNRQNCAIILTIPLIQRRGRYLPPRHFREQPSGARLYDKA